MNVCVRVCTYVTRLRNPFALSLPISFPRKNTNIMISCTCWPLTKPSNLVFSYTPASFEFVEPRCMPNNARERAHTNTRTHTETAGDMSTACRRYADAEAIAAAPATLLKLCQVPINSEPTDWSGSRWVEDAFSSDLVLSTDSVNGFEPDISC